jgi:hypothetical protein
MSTSEQSRKIMTQERHSDQQRQASMLERAEPQANNADEQADITQERARELVNEAHLKEEKRQESMSERMEEAIEKSPVSNPDNPD